MLTASTPPPNTPDRSAPTPGNWRGVAEGLAAAKHAFQSGRHDDAELILRETLEFAPAEAKAWAWLGKVLQVQERHDEARSCLDKAAHLLNNASAEGKQPPASLQLARILWSQGECEAARAMLAVLMIKHPGDMRLHELKRTWEAESSE
jgi:Flp pilus assembly protein TadD